MSERRVSQVLVQQEYTDPDDVRRVSQVIVEVEYKEPTDFRRVSQVSVMIEYTKPWAGFSLIAQTIP